MLQECVNASTGAMSCLSTEAIEAIERELHDLITYAKVDIPKVNNPPQLSQVLSVLENVQTNFNNTQTDGKKVSLADLIVPAGCAALEKAAGTSATFSPGRIKG